MSRSQFQIFLFLAAVLLLGAALAPMLFWAGKWIAGMIVSFKQMETPVIGWIGQKLTSHQFDSYFNRAFLVSALGLLWPFLRWMKLSGDPLGLEKNPVRTGDAVWGFVLAAGFLAALTGAMLAWGAYVREEPVKWAGVISKALMTCLVVALLEEWLFRRIFLGVALRASRPWPAIIVVSALFSILHQVRAPDIIVHDEASREAVHRVVRTADWAHLTDTLRTKPEAADWMIDREYKAFAPSRIHWGSGLEMTTAIFRKKLEPALFVSEFLTLFAIGVILARARCATRSLWLPIGLHAGWIFANALGLSLTKGSAGLEAGQYDLVIGGTRIPWIGDQLKIGLMPLITLLVTAAAVEWRIRSRKPVHLPPDSAS